jgi:hypothetical protein
VLSHSIGGGAACCYEHTTICTDPACRSVTNQVGSGEDARAACDHSRVTELAGVRSIRDGNLGDEKGKQMGFWDFIWLLIWSYLFVAYLVVLFQIIADVFRDSELGGFPKALWILGLIVAPVLIALIYLIVRGRGMAERQNRAARKAQAETDRYIQYVASNPSSADQIASAKALLDGGTITSAEYERLKAKALA